MRDTKPGCHRKEGVFEAGRVKCNAGPAMPSSLYEIELVVLPEQEGQPRVETARLRLLGESEHDGASLLAVPSGEARSAVDEACEFLLAELGEGCGRADEILTRARRLGYSEPTLRRARQKLGIQTSKEGFEGHWRWCIPKASPPLTPSQVTPSTPSPNHADSPPHKSTKVSVSEDDAFDPVQADLDHYRAILARPLLPGDDGYQPWLYERFDRELLTAGEWRQLDRAHRRIVSAVSNTEADLVSAPSAAERLGNPDAVLTHGPTSRSSAGAGAGSTRSCAAAR